MVAVGRRKVLQGGAAALGATLLPRPAYAHAAYVRRPLVRDPQGVIDLPAGFTYRVLQTAGARMDDGYRVPARPDAMGCFVGPGGRHVLMRNHENLVGATDASPYFPGQAPSEHAFDPAATGGVTRLLIDPATLRVERTNLVLAGTYWNCAGGMSPWGWLSCEETDEAGHGYVFLCDPKAETVQPARRLPQLGRMRHEAATTHPNTRITYLTEDRPDGCFYRLVPSDPARPFEGTLQALRVAGEPGVDLGDEAVGRPLHVEWVDLPRALPEDDTLRFVAQAKGAARVRRGEGLWLTGDDLYFCATSGGPAGIGQVLRLTTGATQTVEVVAQAEHPEQLNMPDNITVSPHGQVYVAEDGMGQNHLRRITLEGGVVDFARNALSASEFAGVCFSPDGTTMFVNMQTDGLTLAIRGPFERELEVDRSAATRRVAGGDLGAGGRGLGAGLGVIALAALARRRRLSR